MSKNKGFELKIKNNQGGYTSLYPNTIPEQVIGYNTGSFLGPVEIRLKANDWRNNSQSITVEGITERDVAICYQVLSGDSGTMKEQKEAYNKINPTGVVSTSNQINFTCEEVPSVDIVLKVVWVR